MIVIFRMQTSHSIAQFQNIKRLNLKQRICTINKPLAFGSPRIWQDKSKTKKRRSEGYLKKITTINKASK